MENKITTPEAGIKPKFQISRTLHAPRSLVFELWTKADHLLHWWGPQNFQLGVARMDLHPGGTFHYSMQASDGPKMWGKFVYQVIEAPKRLVFINSFSDEAGNLTRAPFSKTWPVEMENHLTLTQENGTTTLTLEVSPLNATPEEHDIFENGFDSMTQGFGGTFDNLEQYLAKLTGQDQN